MFWFGSWEIGVWRQTTPNFQDYDVFYPPKPADAANACLLPGGPGAAITVNARSQNLEAAVKFAKYLTSKGPQMLYAETSQKCTGQQSGAEGNEKWGPSWPGTCPGWTSFITDTTRNPPMWGEILSKINVEIQSIILGQKTPEQSCKFLDENTPGLKPDTQNKERKNSKLLGSL